MEKISVVVSCYNEEESIPLFYNEIKKVMSIMKEFQFEVLFVDDGSKDRTLEVAKELAKKDECIKYVSFSSSYFLNFTIAHLLRCFNFSFLLHIHD